MSTIQLNWRNSNQHTAIESYYCSTPIGSLRLQMHASLAGKIEWLNSSCESSENTPIQLIQALNQYWYTAKIDYSVPLLEQGTPFQKTVWQALCNIPIAQTKTYGELAYILNTSPRALANACRSNPFPIFIPCHRVVAKTGIGGYAGYTSGPMLAIKHALLQHENRLFHAL